MSKCLTVKPSLTEGVFLFVQSNAIIPISFGDNEIEQSPDGLFLCDS